MIKLKKRISNIDLKKLNKNKSNVILKQRESANDYFNMLDKSIKNIASKADLLMFNGKILKADKDEIFEDCLILSCFYTAFYRKRPPFLLDFVEKDNIKDKLTVEEKKKLGAFFTPPYIAEYICKNTIQSIIDKILKNKKIKDKVKKICKLKICDLAMGGGIFLVCTHDLLMENLIKIKQTKHSISAMSSMSSKAVFGVDINPVAVEFSKMVMHLNIAKWKILEKLDEYVKTVA